MIYRARVLVPMDGPPVQDGAVVVRGGSIAAAGRWEDVRARVRGRGGRRSRRGRPAARVHQPPLPPRLLHLAHAILPPRNFSEWVGRINALKRTLDPADYLAAIAKGFREGGPLGHDGPAQHRILPRIDVEDAAAPPADVVVLRDDRRAQRHRHGRTRRGRAAVLPGNRPGPGGGRLVRRPGPESARALHGVAGTVPACARLRPRPGPALDGPTWANPGTSRRCSSTAGGRFTISSPNWAGRWATAARANPPWPNSPRAAAWGQSASPSISTIGRNRTLPWSPPADRWPG